MHKMEIDDEQESGCTWETVPDVTKEEITQLANTPSSRKQAPSECTVMWVDTAMKLGHLSYLCAYYALHSSNYDGVEKGKALRIAKKNNDQEELRWLKCLLQKWPYQSTISLYGPWSSRATTFFSSVPDISHRLTVNIKADVDTTAYKPFLEKVASPIPLTLSLQRGKDELSKEVLELIRDSRIGRVTIEYVDIALPTDDRIIRLGEAIGLNNNICAIAILLQTYDEKRIRMFLSSVSTNTSLKAIDINIRDHHEPDTLRLLLGTFLETSKQVLALHVSTLMSGKSSLVETALDLRELQGMLTKRREKFKDMCNRLEADSKVTQEKFVAKSKWRVLLKYCIKLLPLLRFADSELFQDGKTFIYYEINRSSLQAANIRMQYLWQYYYPPLAGVKETQASISSHILDLPKEILQHIMTFVPMESVSFTK